MTINQLHKITAKLIEQGAGRRGVCVSKDTFKHPLESDGATIVTVENADLAVFPIMDDDGGTAFDSREREKQSMALVIEGGPRGEAMLGAGWIDCADRVPGHLHSVLGYVTSGGLVVMDEKMIDIVSYDPERKAWLQCVNCEDAEVKVSHWSRCPTHRSNRGVGERKRPMPLESVARKEDMSHFGRLIVCQQEDGDVIVVLDGRDSLGDPVTSRVEFCCPGSGGGRSPNTIKALRELAKAIAADNAVSPT